MVNDNCLEGIACPHCGNDSRVYIEVTTLAVVTDDGAETYGDMAWDEGSYAECPACHYCGRLKEFRVESATGSTTSNEKE